jgi:hypothetical protein
MYLMPVQLNGFYSHSVFTGVHVCIIDRHLLNMNINVKNIGRLHIGSKKSTGFTENGYHEFD